MIEAEDAEELALGEYHAALLAALQQLQRARDASRRFGWVSTTRVLRALIARLSALDRGHGDPAPYDDREVTP